LTLRVDNDPETVRNSDATDASNKGFCLCSARADANGPKSLVPTLPISILLLPVVRLKPAEAPNAMLLLPVVFRLSALEPMAVLSKPVVLLRTHQKTSCRI